MTVVCRGVRGAHVVAENTPEAIFQATSEILEQMVEANGIAADEIAAAIFTVTPDLNADFPARAARARGWQDVALLCATEIDVPDSLKRCIRVLILWNTDRTPQQLVHCYLGDAVVLRPDRGGSPQTVLG